MLLPGRHANTASYRYGFQGQELDNELKGEGNNYDYSFRFHDPRVGRFLSTDPISRQFSHNSPYAFAENRVIDGVELEGLEYLWYDEALTEMFDGTLFIKLKNFSEPFQDAFRQSNKYYGLIYYDQSTGLAQGEGMLASLAAPEQKQSRRGRSNNPKNYSTPNTNSYDVNKRQLMRKDGKTPDGRSKASSQSFVHAAPSAKGGVLAFTFALDILNESIKMQRNIAIGDDFAELSRQTKSFTYFNKTTGEIVNQNIAVVDRVLADMRKAREMGIIKDENMNYRDISDIFNIVMFGGNFNEGEEIREVAQEIIDKIIPEDLKRQPRIREKTTLDKIKDTFDDVKGKMRSVMPTGG